MGFVACERGERGRGGGKGGAKGGGGGGGEGGSLAQKGGGRLPVEDLQACFDDLVYANLRCRLQCWKRRVLHVPALGVEDLGVGARLRLGLRVTA